jgi:hypothetical protein
MHGEISLSDMVKGFFCLLCDMVASFWFIIFLRSCQYMSGEESEAEDEKCGGVDGGAVRESGGNNGWLGSSLGRDGISLQALGRAVLGSRGQFRSRCD